MEYIKRSGGGNVCRKAAYNARDKIVDEKTGEVFSFKNRGGCVYHEVLLPVGANQKFKDSGTLWNAANAAETRINSQLAKEVVLALPDNKEITLDDKVELVKRFANKYFVDKGVAVHVDIHSPDNDEDKNWHAHLMIATRRFTEDGNSFSKHKARDLDPQVRKFKVVEGELWGRIWRDLQNDYFKEKGLDIRVDEIGAIAQEHLGPVRMRKHMSNIQQRAAELKEANREASTDPDIVITHLSHIHAAFTEKHLDNYLHKHVVDKLRAEVKGGVLTHPNLVQLYNKHTGEKVGYYTTKEVRAEEERVLREGDRINLSAKIQVASSIAQRIIKERTFSEEQLSVFKYAVEGDQGIKVIEGRAGTGKSHVMHGIREAYERSGGTVIGLAKANTVKNDMLCSGFAEAYTVKKYMFLHNNNKVDIKNGSIFIVDEAALLETPSFNELFKVAREHACKVILVGDDRQQTSIERGGMFPILAERYGSQELKEVRRQSVEWQKHVSEYLSEGSFNKAIGLLEYNQRLYWHATKEGSFSALVEQWCRDSLSNPETRLVLAHRNIDVDTINQAIQQVQQSLGKVSTKEFVCQTNKGEIGFGAGDRVLFSSTDKELGLFNGDMGTLVETNKNKFVVLKDSGEKISFDPGMYKGLNLAYATTIFKGQGKTVDTAYVFHSPTMNEKQAYVSLTRQVNDVHLYVSKDETKNANHLVIQMGREDDKISSLEFHTEAEMAKRQKMEGSNFHKFAYNIEDRVKSIIHKVADRIHHNAEFYSYTPEKTGPAASIRVRDATERWKQEEAAYAAKDGSDKDKKENISDKTVAVVPKVSAKETDTLSSLKENKRLIDASHVEDALKKDIRGFVIHLLGEPDKKLSSARELCFRKDGKVFVNLETGLWKDFVNDTGGNLFGLIQREHGGEFKDALAYGAAYAGLSDKSPKGIAKNENNVAKTAAKKGDDLKAADAEKADKVKRVQSLYNRSISVAGTLGERYLREHRAIRGDLSADLRFGDRVYNSEFKKEMPALLAFARDNEGNVKACQAIYLDKSTGNKADISPAKKTFGMLAGSFVEIQKGQGNTYIAEGVETALSVKETGVSGNIVASFGIQNMKHFDRKAETLIICADNDGSNAPSRTVIKKSRDILERNGYSTRIIEPNRTGEDFNDVLKKEGRAGVAQYFGFETRTQQKVHEQRSHAEHLQKAEPITKTSTEVNANLTSAEKLADLTKQYQKQLENIFREKVGDSYKHAPYKAEIDAIASRTAQEALVRGNTKYKDRVLLGKNQYELKRLEELKVQFTANDKRAGDTWMQHHLKAEMVVGIEGRLFAAARQEKDTLSKEDKTKVQQEARGIFNGSSNKLKAYQHEAQQSFGLSSEGARMFAIQRLIVEEKYGLKSLTHELAQALLKAVEYGQQKYTNYHEQFADKLKTQNGTIGDRESKYIDLAAKYKAHQEVREIIAHTLSSKDGAFPNKQDLQKIDTKVEKGFRANKSIYDKQQLQQQKEQEKAQTKQIDRGRGR